jgi:hypothetical protein
MATSRVNTNQSLKSLETQTSKGKLTLRGVRGIASPLSTKSASVTIRLAGAWLEIWELLKEGSPSLSDSDLLRQALALLAAINAEDSKGKKPQALIRFHDETGELVTVDLEEHVGIANK